MKSLSTVILFLVVVFSTSAEVYSQSASQIAEAGHQGDRLAALFSRSRQAIGDSATIDSLKNLHVEANCEGPNGKYKTTIDSWFDGKVRFLQERESETSTQAAQPSVINGDYAWQMDADGEYSLLAPFHTLVIELHEYQRMAVDFQSMFSDFEWKGTEKFGGKSCTMVQAKHRLGQEIFLYFDEQTSLFSGYILPIPGTDEVVTNVFDDWRIVDGLRLPSKVTATDARGEFILNFDTITLNQCLAERVAVPPRVHSLKELLDLHGQQRHAHLTYDPELLVDLLADDCVQIKDGEFSQSTREENIERFRKYFGSFKFEKWDDTQAPQVRMSQDATLATIAVRKRVRGTWQDDGKEVVGDTIFAWLEVWEKGDDDQWKIVTIASTDRPATDE